MGWYGEENEKCPNCKGNNASTQFGNDMNGPLFLACPDCGLRMHCRKVAYIVSNSYIDTDIIGKKSLSFLDLKETDINKDEKIIKDITYQIIYQT